MKVVALLPVVIFAVARALAQAPPDPAAVQAEIAELLVAYPNTEYSWQQTDIARRLVAIGDPAVVDSIELYLDTTDRRRRCNAAYVLAAFGDERGTQVLVGELEDTGTDKRAMREGVSRTGPPSREADLRRQVVSDRYLAALLLGDLRSKAAVPALIAASCLLVSGCGAAGSDSAVPQSQPLLSGARPSPDPLRLNRAGASARRFASAYAEQIYERSSHPLPGSAPSVTRAIRAAAARVLGLRWRSHRRCSSDIERLGHQTSLGARRTNGALWRYSRLVALLRSHRYPARQPVGEFGWLREHRRSDT